MSDLSGLPLPADSMGLLEGLTTMRSIRRYRDEPVPDEVLRAVLFAATRAPSGSNRQLFKFVVLQDGPNAQQAKALIGGAARRVWGAKRTGDGFDAGTGADPNSRKARLARAMQEYVDCYERAPVLILACLSPWGDPPILEPESLYPACQNLLLAARGLGYGGVLTSFHHPVQRELRALLHIPDGVMIGGSITLGRPAGRHGPVRRRPLGQFVAEEAWDGATPDWAVDPPGVDLHGAGPVPGVSAPLS